MHDSILEFYFSVDGNKKTLLDLNEYVRNHNDQVGKYRGNMYCIECRKAQLEYVRECIGRRAYLKTKPGQRHERWCSYNYDIANEKYIKKYYNDLTYNQVQNKLLSTLRYIQGITSKVSKSGEFTIQVQRFVKKRPITGTMLYRRKIKETSRYLL